MMMPQVPDSTIEPIKVPETASIQGEKGIAIDVSNGHRFRLTITKGVVLAIITLLIGIYSR
jgi:hypothetical protein